MAIEIKVVNVTPDMATRWLYEKNKHNRPLYQSRVELYARDMKQGLWVLNHQGICFDDEGNLMDGQHRLEALITSGKTVPFYIFRNVPKTYKFDGVEHWTQETIDAHKPRSLADEGAIVGAWNNANLRASMIRILIMLCSGSYDKISIGIGIEIEKIYHSEIDKIIEASGNTRGLKYAPVLGAFAFAAKCYKEKTIEFEIGYFSGENLSSHSPILTLRNYILSRAAWGGTRSYRGVIVNATLNALMHYILETPLKRIVSTAQGVTFFANKQRKISGEIAELLKL